MGEKPERELTPEEKKMEFNRLYHELTGWDSAPYHKPDSEKQEEEFYLVYWDKKFDLVLKPLSFDLENDLIDNLRISFSNLKQGLSDGVFGYLPQDVIYLFLGTFAKIACGDTHGEIVTSLGIPPLYSILIESSLNKDAFQDEADSEGRKEHFESLLDLLNKGSKAVFGASPSEETKIYSKKGQFLFPRNLEYLSFLRLGDDKEFIGCTYSPDVSKEKFEFQTSHPDILEEFVGAFRRKHSRNLFPEEPFTLERTGGGTYITHVKFR